MRINEPLLLLQKISAPYASSFVHVQGPGGNTSVKFNGKMIIKASGFTFGDVAEGNGYVVINIKDVFSDGIFSNRAAEEIVLKCRPPHSRPSMEFQFHAILDKFVLHTHSVYAGVVLCCDSSASVLNSIFDTNDFLLLHYVTPGLPIAEQLIAEMKKKTLPPVIFLKNHGMIIHHNDSDKVLQLYDHVLLSLKKNLILDDALDDWHIKKYPSGAEITLPGTDFKFLTERQLTDSVLIPDQSVFFRDKTGYKNESKPVMIDAEKRMVTITGTSRFVHAGIEMLQAVLYIRRQLKKLGFAPQFLKQKDIDDIHGLEAEKHRISTLN
ncbi:MAG TPA: class II aldolase/adducin family protein [Chitinophagales bacterium]|nr:class II aldolase/adducin family protein [Chitinophagales bacterium]